MGDSEVRTLLCEDGRGELLEGWSGGRKDEAERGERGRVEGLECEGGGGVKCGGRGRE